MMMIATKQKIAQIAVNIQVDISYFPLHTISMHSFIWIISVIYQDILCTHYL